MKKKPQKTKTNKKQIKEQPTTVEVENIPFEQRVAKKLEERQMVEQTIQPVKTNELPVSEYVGKDFLNTMQSYKL